MNTQQIESFSVLKMKSLDQIAPEAINGALIQAEARLEIWQKKSYYERVAMLARVADQMSDKTGQLSLLIALEIDKLLAQSHEEITLM
ncbi:aldehyde dehydrogenase family protein [Mucilaginibacter lappiensis]|uniref:Acyl-CoA reductase-like NAD-dependent aldehyde dehydrogenase n=1 Tax=Mucilaginibacter lappiensis TaxID=354630 RepID=A0A1N7GEW6_9SPHI|nr:aldehyde dehydrogenase family protein [Mucilaginibacter lappiensis]MBB6113026.1 acyl-CoA reductase-like NAD-dependent aldehyde dehydrogenase [Mucilaginibacter lappiensis]MBB6130681.1 acyl-CoA reductase-like NAD-dependent aldehyde dehydrogenase [Mucilaginibacter lappiensis]SIS11165.1 Aldehyde dehydrogenase family protein [Mucilaginibacter lappiensis]